MQQSRRNAATIGFKQIHAIDTTDEHGESDLLRVLGHGLGSLPSPSTAPQAAATRNLVGIFAAVRAALILTGPRMWLFAGGSAGFVEATTEDKLTAVAVLAFRLLSQEEDRYLAELPRATDRLDEAIEIAETAVTPRKQR